MSAPSSTLSRLACFLFSCLVLLQLQPVHSFPATSRAKKSSSSQSDVSVTFNGVNYVNKGLVAIGVIPSDFRESTGDTLGGIGSAIAIKYGTWRQSEGGTFAGTFVVHPDRGFNVNGTIDYQARQHEIDFILSPYTDSKKLSYEDAQRTLQLTYTKTTLQVDRDGVKTTGLDPLGVKPAVAKVPAAGPAAGDPEMPIASDAYPHLSLDVEGIVANSDGSYWISDEYGPYVYRFSAEGNLLQVIQPPAAILPHDASGNINFTAGTDPATGRAGNQGFESLTLDAENNVLYTMLQSATIQDGGDDKSTSRYTRLLAYDISATPTLVGEWVVPLPQSSKGNTLACSEILFVSAGTFLALSRDGDGRSGDDTESKYKQADLFSISDATDIHGSKFDDPANPIAVDGVLDDDITPATYISFVDFIDDKQLARFGMHNDDPDNTSLIDAKWESLALAPVDDPAFPDDYFLFTAADNDFISTKGIALGVPFDAGLDVDNQFLVFRVTLPGVQGLRKVLGVS